MIFCRFNTRWVSVKNQQQPSGGPIDFSRGFRFLGFRVWGLGSRVWGSRVGGKGIEIRVQGLGLGALGFRASGLECGVKGSGRRVWGLGFKV